MSRDEAVRAAAEALCEPSCIWRIPGLDAPCGPHTQKAQAAVDAAAPILLAGAAAVREPHHSGHGVPGHPCHELYSRCFRTDDDLRAYRVRQREHGARVAVAAERARIAGLLRDARDAALARATEARNRFQPSDADMWETRADAYERAALDAETAPEEPS